MQTTGGAIINIASMGTTRRARDCGYINRVRTHSLALCRRLSSNDRLAGVCSHQSRCHSLLALARRLVQHARNTRVCRLSHFHWYAV